MELPEPPEIVVGDSVQVRLVELETIERLTVPVKPFSGVTVIVELPRLPAFTAICCGFAEMVKSFARTMTT
jgi:hypothetical protein